MGNLRKSFRSTKETSQIGILLKIFCVLGLCALSFLFHAWMRTEVVTTSYKVGKGRKLSNDLEAELLKLQVQKGRIMGPRNLERVVLEQKSIGRNLFPSRPDQLFFAEEAVEKTGESAQ